MSNNMIEVLLQARIDSQSISNMKKQLDGIQSQSKPINVKVKTEGTKKIKDMSSSIEKLEQVTKKNLMLDLEKMSGRYGKLIKTSDVTNIKSMINALSAKDPKLGHNIDLIKVKMKEVSVGAQNSKKSLDLANKSAMSFGSAISTAAVKFGIWSAVTVTYYKAIREISSGIKYITEMDSALTEIGIVTNQTREQTAALAVEYNKLAKEMKVLTSEIASGAVTFYRQGLSQEEVMERLRVTTMYSKVANVEFAQSAELLTATVNSMNVPIEKAADIFTYLGDATATSAAEVGTGVSKVSGSASALGVELEKVSSWIAHVSSRTRESAESIGNSMKTILTRISRISKSGFDEEDGTKINDVAKALNTVNIELLETDGSFRNFGTIVDEIGEKWVSLDDQTKSYIATTIAGVRQQSRFLNLMNDYSKSVELYEGALESAGTAQSKFNLYLESNQATLDEFRAAIDGLWTTILDSDALMSIVRTGTEAIETLEALGDQFGILGTTLTFVIPLLGIKFVWAIRSTQIELTKLYATSVGKNATALVATTGDAIRQMLGFKTATQGASIAVSGLTLKTIALTAGLAAIPVILMHIAKKSREAKEAFNNALDNSQSLSDDVKNLERLSKKQEELSKIENKSVEQKQELIKVQQDLARTYPELATGIDNEGNELAENIELTKQLTENKRKLLEQELLVIKTTADTRLPQLRSELSDLQKDSQEIQDRLASGDVYEDVYSSQTGMIVSQIDVTQQLKDDLLELVSAQRKNLEETAKLENGLKSYNQIIKENEERQKWARVEELQNQSTRAKSIDQLSAIEKELKDLGFTSTDVSNIISGNIDLVKEKYEELDMQQIINLQTIETLDETQKQANINMLESSRDATKSIIEDVKARITAYINEAKALAALTGGKVKDANILSKKSEINPQDGLLSTLSNQSRNEAIDAKRELLELEGNLKNIEKALNNVKSINTSGISGTRNSSSSTKDKKDNNKPDYIDTLDAEIRAIKSKNDNLIKTNILLKEQLDIASKDDSLEGLNKQYKLTGELITHNEEVLKSFKAEQDLVHKRANDIREQYSGYNIDGWFDANGEQAVAYIEQYNNATKDQQEEMNKVFSQVQKLKKAWMDTNDEMKNVIQTTGDLEKEIDNIVSKQEKMARDIVRKSIEAEKRNKYMDLDLRKRRADEELKHLREEMQGEVDYWQSRIDNTQSQIDKIQEDEKYRAEQKERKERLDEIARLQDKYYTLQYDNLMELSEEQAKAIGLEEERTKQLENQARVQELLLRLENVRREKNIQQLVKNEDGTWGFEYVADQREIDKLTKDITEIQEDNSKFIKDLKENTLSDLRQKQEDYDEWERQNEIQADIERRRRRIERYQREINDLQNKFKEKEEKTKEAFDIEQENLDRHYMDMDILTDERLKELFDTFDNNWSAIYHNTKSYFDKLEEDYRELIEIMSKPIPNTKKSSSSGGGGGGSSGRYTSTSSERKKYKEDNARYSRENSKEIDRISREHGVDSGVARDMAKANDRAGKKVYHDGGWVFSDNMNSLHRGLRHDEVPAILQAGEYVLSKKMIREIAAVNIDPDVINALRGTQANGSIKQSVHIEKLEFPNVHDAREIEASIKNLSAYANQWANRK